MYLHRPGMCSACSHSHFSHLFIDVYFLYTFLGRKKKKKNLAKRPPCCMAVTPPKTESKSVSKITVVIYSSPVKQHKISHSEQKKNSCSGSPWAGGIQTSSPTSLCQARGMMLAAFMPSAHRDSPEHQQQQGRPCRGVICPATPPSLST